MDSHLLKDQVDRATAMVVWPDVDELVEQWTNILQTKEATRGLDRDGEV